MSDKFSPPKMEKRNTAVAEQVATEKESIVINASGPQTAVDIYKSAIDEFVKFLKGEVAAGSLDERRKFQKSFVKSTVGMLDLDYQDTKAVLDYFLVTVSEEQNAFSWNNVLAPLASIEGAMSNSDLNRYKQFILFITLLSEHARNRTQFTQMFDMTKFEASFPLKARTNLHNYVYR